MWKCLLLLLLLVGCASARTELPTSGRPSVSAPPICDAHRHGAAGDGITKDTAALQRAIDACATTGGIVVLDHGTFLSGTLRLRSHVTLRIEAGATLLGSRDDADYPTQAQPFTNTELSACQRALVYAQDVEDVHIDGAGTIDGNADIDKWRGLALPEGARPMAIFTTLSRGVTISGITVRNAATWAVVNMQVQHLVIRGITVDSPHGPTHDGIDVVDGRDVLIEDVTITAGDDGICLKSGSRTGLQDVTVRRARILGTGVANGLKLGTATVGAMRHLVFEDISIRDAQAAAMAVESVDGGEVADLQFRRVTIEDVGTPFFVMLGSRRGAVTGAIHDVRFETIRGVRLRYPWGALVSGAPGHAVGGITFRDVSLAYRGAGDAHGPRVFGREQRDAARFPEYAGGYPDPKFLFATPADKSEAIDYALPGWAFFVRHAHDVRFEDCRIGVDAADHRPARATVDARTRGECHVVPVTDLR